MLNPTVVNETVIGVDLGTKKSTICVLKGKSVVAELEIKTRAIEIQETFATMASATVVMEVGTCSRWVSRLIASLGFEVVVVAAESLKDAFNPRGKGRRRRKTDARDAEALARLYAADPNLLRRIEHRPDRVYRDLCWIRTRDHLVRLRTRAMLRVRGVLRALGVELPRVSSESFVKKVFPDLSTENQELVREHCHIITTLNGSIRALERKLDQVAKRYPETECLMQITGVGPVSALAFVLIVARKDRFKRNRDVAAYLGLVPRKLASGDVDPELSITKTGDKLMRRLLVQCAHYIIGRRCVVDSDLRRFGLALAARGRKAAKKRAAVAVARKLAVLLMSLWKSRAEYVPLKNSASSSSAA
jgi:transposase